MLTVEDLSKSYGEKTLFDKLNCSVQSKDRIGLIGVNGTGKSSFLKIIAGLDTPDSGVVKHAGDYRIEYLAQEPELSFGSTVIDQIYYGNSDIMIAMRSYEAALVELEANSSDERAQSKLMKAQEKMDAVNAWDASAEAKTILTRLGVTKFDEKIENLSGGQKKRVAIARALIQPANLLILDEPTNHLDNVTVEWLENYLANYNGALLLVTHDRYFLNRVTNRIFELDRGHLYVYQGNYELFLEKKAERETVEELREERHANTLRRELAWLRRGAKARSTKQKARIGRVEEMKNTTFETDKSELAFEAGSTRLGKKVIELSQVSKVIANRTLINSFDYLLKPGDRIGIIGPNGVGKTTLLNIMAERIPIDSGVIEIGETVKIGYYTQGEEELDGQMRIIDYIKETAQVIHTKTDEIITAEQMLERFLFSRAQQYTYIYKLSGGEKRRLYLLKVLMTEPNVLFLDEPTNDLDIQTLGILEEYLHVFPGVVVTVSHDRYFLDRVVDQLLVFKEAGKISSYYGNYSEYLEDEQMQTKAAKVFKKTEEQPIVTETKKEKTKKVKLSYREQKEWETIEEDIEVLETELENIETSIGEAGSDSEKVQKLFEKQGEVELELETKMERWETLSIIVEEINEQKNV